MYWASLLNAGPKTMRKSQKYLSHEAHILGGKTVNKQMDKYSVY